jgi:hypothetical protein
VASGVAWGCGVGQLRGPAARRGEGLQHRRHRTAQRRPAAEVASSEVWEAAGAGVGDDWQADVDGRSFRSMARRRWAVASARAIADENFRYESRIPVA